MKLVSSLFTILLISSLCYAVPIPQGTAQQAAEWAAESVWGELNLLEAKVLLRPDGSTSAYCFTFGRDGVTYIDESIILEGYNLRQSGYIDEGWEVARDPDSYAYAIISADNQYGPILEMCDGLPAHKVFREDVKDMGEVFLGSSVEIFEMYYLFPLENWFRVSDSQTALIVNPRRYLTSEDSGFANFMCLYDMTSNPTSPYYWDLVLTQPVPAFDDEGYIPDVPNYNQEDTDCGPHSSAQATGYWDDHTYLSAGPWDLLIDVDFWGLRDEMRDAMGWVSGSGVTMTEIRDGIEDVCNDAAYNNNYDFDVILYNNPAYSACADAVDGGRPGVIATFNHPYYGNHAMTLVGYNDVPTQMIQVHDNWPPSNDEPWLDWGTWFDGFVDIFPAGGGSTTPITLASFTATYQAGGVMLNWQTACEIDCYGYNLLRDGIMINDNVIPAMGSACETTTYSYLDDEVRAGQNYRYELQTVFNDGGSEISADVTVRSLTHALDQNVPNPFNPVTTIRYEVPVAGYVTLTVYDVMGHEVTRLVDSHQEANVYSLTFNASGLASGIYFYKLDTDGFSSIKKMVLVK